MHNARGAQGEQIKRGGCLFPLVSSVENLKAFSTDILLRPRISPMNPKTVKTANPVTVITVVVTWVALKAHISPLKPLSHPQRELYVLKENGSCLTAAS